MSTNLDTEIRIKSHLIQKHDLEVNWDKATGFVPYKGQLIIYDIEVDAEGNTLKDTEEKLLLPEGRTTPYTYERIKIGDGIKIVSELPFIDNTSLKYIVQELTEAQKAQARANIDAAKTISSANIPYINGGGFQIDALEAYNQVDSTKQDLPVTIADIKAVLNNFPLNLAEMQRAMLAGAGTFGEQGCAGILPIPREASLRGDFSDLPLFTTAPQKPSIAVRKDNGTLAVCDPISEDDATTKKYVDESIDTKTSVTVGGTHQETFDADTKLDKKGQANLPRADRRAVYAIDTTGNQILLKVGSVGSFSTVSDASGIPIYDAGGHLYVNPPTLGIQVANKTYVDNNFVKKTGDTITGDLTITGNLQIKGISETVDAVTYKVENNLIEFNPDKTYNNTWLTGIAVNKGIKDETDLGTYGIMYDPNTDSVKLGFGAISENHTFAFNENESAPIATREEFNDSWEDDAIFVFDKDTKSFKYSGKTLESYKKEIQDEMKAYMAQFVADYIETYMSSETIVYPDGTTETNSDILYVNGTISEEIDSDSSIILKVTEE